MSNFGFNENGDRDGGISRQPEVILADVVPEGPAFARPMRRRVRLPLMLFIATCLSTLVAGYVWGDHQYGWKHALAEGMMYAGAIMTILICHEAGHWLQARRYGVHASYPYFIPMPISPIGTFGAVIAMQAHMGDRKALFDIGITGPLAGLIPTVFFCIVGLKLSHVVPPSAAPGDLSVAVPYLFSELAGWLLEPMSPDQAIALHPLAFAGWVGLLITALNLLPIGQLDGGHILYGLLRTNSHKVAMLLLLTAIVLVILYGLLHWTLMLFLLMLMGPSHPPTADDNVPLGPVRIVLGWATLAFIPIGFTPTPFLMR